MFHQATVSVVPSGHGLPPDLLAKARTRIAGLAGVLGTLSLIAVLLNATVFRDDVGLTVHLQHVLAMALALIVIVTARSSRVTAVTALTIGLVYEVCLCWIVSFAAQHAAIGLVGRAPEITWASMIIVVFPMVIPLPPRRILIASTLAAIGSPASLLVLDYLGEHALTLDELVGATISPAFAVVLAYVGARMIYAIGRDVAKARLLGAYRLESRLGAGGMGEVWRASHRMLARPAAVKLISPEQLGRDDRAVLTRFEQEAQATAQLRSPHTVEVYDFGISSEGSFYYVMELLDGLDLQKLVERHGPVPAARVVHILRQVCHSLDEAHAAGMVHRDVKPANIFVCRYGGDLDFVKVLDFGLVKTPKPEGDSALTGRGQFVGTPAFLAPEIAAGSDVDGRADIYSLGCVAYWLLTGTVVFEAESFLAMAAKHLNEEPVPPSSRTEAMIPADLEAIVLSCLRKDPDDRPGADELASRLSACEIPVWTKEHARRWWQSGLADDGVVASSAFS